MPAASASADRAGPMLEATDLACMRGDALLFRKLSFAVEAGEVLWIEGANGTGKTSLLRILAGLSPPEQGEVRWRGQSLTRGRDALRADVLYLGHLNALKDDLTVVENLRFHAAIAGYPADARAVDDAVMAVGLQARRDLPVRVLSQGQRRRAALARLWLAQSRPFWILDEPFAALDVASVDRLAARLADHVGAGGIAVLTTHQEVALPAGHTRRLRLDAS